MAARYAVVQALGTVTDASMIVALIRSRYALVRLRAQAFATGRSVAEMARDVVERRVRFEA
jgi:hypothetical protein